MRKSKQISKMKLYEWIIWDIIITLIVLGLTIFDIFWKWVIYFWMGHLFTHYVYLIMGKISFKHGKS